MPRADRCIWRREPASFRREHDYTNNSDELDGERVMRTAMSLRTRRNAIAAVAMIAMALLGLAMPAYARADGGRLSDRGAQGDRQQNTTLVLKVPTCPRCTIDLTRAITGHQKVWRSKNHHVRDGKVSFVLPTARTEGLSFEISAPWDNACDCNTNIVTRYHGIKPGERLTDAVARHKHHAEGCWAGTQASTFTMTVHVARFKGLQLNGQPGHVMRAYFNAQVDSIGPMTRAFRGTLGNQEAFFCTLS
jgi:hypothetical protein